MIITYNELKLFVEDNIIGGVHPSHINAASIDVTLGDHLFIETAPKGGYDRVDLAKKETPNLELVPIHGFYDLAPGQFCLGSTLETFNLPNDIVAEFRLKSSGARSGLDAALAMYCFTGDTEIPLLDGGSRPIKDLVGGEHWVYSMDSKGEVKPGLATKVFKSGEVRQTVIIVLDDGAKFECTPEHLIMLRNGEYRKARDLVTGASLMPLGDRNHTVTEVHLVEHKDPIAVYDMTVPGLHNFAIDAGVFVHNCDPGWHGSVLTLELRNNLHHHHLRLRPGMKVGQVFFMRGETVPDYASYAVKGRYNNDRGATPSKGLR